MQLQLQPPIPLIAVSALFYYIHSTPPSCVRALLTATPFARRPQANTFVTTRLELLLRDAKQYGIFTQAQCLSFLGKHFRLFLPLSDDTSDEGTRHAASPPPPPCAPYHTPLIPLIDRLFRVPTDPLLQRPDACWSTAFSSCT